MTGFKTDKLKKNAIINVIRQLLTVIFPLITFPYVSRIMGSENLGKVAFTGSIVSYISLIAGLGVRNYAIREGSRLKGDSIRLRRFVSEVFTLNMLALLVAYGILGVVIYAYAYTYDYKILLLIQGLTVFFNIAGCEWMNVVFEDYLFITVRYALLHTISIILMFCFVRDSSDIFLYAMIGQFANIVGGIVNLVYFYTRRGILPSITISRGVFDHLKPAMVMFATQAAMLIYVSSDITIIGIVCGDSEAGIYSVAVRIYTIVKELLNALTVVGIPRMARWVGVKSRDDVDSQLDGILKTLLVFMMPCMTGLYCQSDCAVLILAGEGFVGSVEILRILAVTLFFSTGVCFYSNLVLIPNNMERHILRATVLSACINIGLNFVCIPKWGIAAAAVTTMISEMVTVGYMIVVSRRVYFPKVLGAFVVSGVAAMLVFGICEIVGVMISGYVLRAIVAVALSISAWGMMRWLASRMGMAI